jgi:hypothetical protein
MGLAFNAPVLNHYETVYRPGESRLVEYFFRTLGFETQILGPEKNPFIMGFKDAEAMNNLEVYIAASEALPDQWSFDQALARSLRQGELGDLFATFNGARFESPYFTTHVGMQFESLEDWESAVTHLQNIERVAAPLAGRVELCRVLRPGDSGSLSDITHQAFLWTDLVACGSLALGQLIEFQYFDFDAYRAQKSLAC